MVDNDRGVDVLRRGGLDRLINGGCVPLEPPVMMASLFSYGLGMVTFREGRSGELDGGGLVLVWLIAMIERSRGASCQ